jgi:hypothetical protein
MLEAGLKSSRFVDWRQKTAARDVRFCRPSHRYRDLCGKTSLLLIKYCRGDADNIHGIDSGICGLFFITAAGSFVSGWLFWHGESANVMMAVKFG